MGVPEVDAIDGLPPAVALQQQRGTPTHALVGRQRHDAVEPAADAVLARRRLPAAASRCSTPRRSRPTRRRAPARTATASGRVYEVTEQSMVPDDSLTHPRARHRRLAAGVARPEPARHPRHARLRHRHAWRELPKKDRDWILFTDEQPTVPVYAGFTPAETRARAASARRSRATWAPSPARARYVLQTFATTQSALMKKRVSRYMVEHRLPGLPRQAAAPRGAVGDVRRPRHRRAVAAAAEARWRDVLRPYADGDGAGCAKRERGASRRRRSSRSASPRTSWRASPCCSTSASATSRSSAARRRSRPASCSGCGSRRRSAPTCSASSTCSTSRRPACIPADTEALLRALDRLKALGQLAVRRRARARRDPPRRLDRRRRPRRPASTAARVLYSGPPDGLRERRGLADARATCSPSATPRARTPRARRRAGCGSPASRATTCDALDVALSARRAHRGDRRLGLGQVEPGEPGAGRAGRRAPRPRASTPDEDEADELERDAPSPRSAAASPAAWSASSGWCASTRSRSAARRARTSPPTPGLFDHVRKLFAATQGGARAPLRRRPLLVQRRQGPLRDLRGRRLRDGRAALPAERLRALPDLPRRALQREDARDHATAARTSPRCSA